ncbi:MAG TPA: FAD-dependent monooxygenase [Streptosporangiaceae bacterium]|nr:FAD-dependent monooxygenase [Streptosporangiaceae bacterium]
MAVRETSRIAIVGGGIGGLATCAFLHRAGLAATVYEQAPRLTEVGAGLVVAPNAVRLLRRLGVLPPFLARAVALEWGWEFRRWENGAVLSAERLTGVCERLYGERTYVTHRADLLDAIKSAVPHESVRLGARCTGVRTRSDGVRLSFADGGTADADIVIGADGMHSVVRAAIADPAPPRDSGMCAFRALVPAERAPALARRPAQTLWVGPGHHLVHYPISGLRTVNLVAFAPAGEHIEESWSATATVEEFLAEFTGWDPRVTELIRAAGTPGRWALLDRPPLPRWSTARVTLLGDAAHPMFPFYAQGAAQAIEDAAVLAVCLAADPGEPERAFKRYESLRIERTARIQRISHARADSNHLPDGPRQRARDADLADADPLVRNGWIYGHDAEAAAARGAMT